MTADPRSALSVFVAALETHLETAAVRRGKDDPSVVAAYERVAEAFTAYEDALHDAYREVTPLVLFDEDLAADEDDDDFEDEGDEDDDEGDDDGDDDDDGAVTTTTRVTTPSTTTTRRTTTRPTRGWTTRSTTSTRTPGADRCVWD
ncbi:hypothetical protein [Ornithinimicrobium flavum]|uniref:hypothetical protein n=1 Tax=Ornithinimicrobium flavum TaxID=1288636 RepID=UPI00130530BE